MSRHKYEGAAIEYAFKTEKKYSPAELANMPHTLMCDSFLAGCEHVDQDLQDAKRLIRELVEAVEFYSKTGSWESVALDDGLIVAEDIYQPWGEHGISVGGKTARSCLAKNQDAIKKFGEGV